jgi:magnesium chelatase subunit D
MVDATDAAQEAAMERARLAEELEKASAEAPSGMTMTDITSGPATFPLAGVVGQEAIKTALILCGVNPSIGGVVISGSRGTAKSVMARAIHKLMPPIEVIKGSDFNIDASSGEFDSFLRDKMIAENTLISDLELEVIPTPFVQIPLDVMEDRLLGAVDVEQQAQSVPLLAARCRCGRPPLQRPARWRTAALWSPGGVPPPLGCRGEVERLRRRSDTCPRSPISLPISLP